MMIYQMIIIDYNMNIIFIMLINLIHKYLFNKDTYYDKSPILD